VEHEGHPDAPPGHKKPSEYTATDGRQRKQSQDFGRIPSLICVSEAIDEGDDRYHQEERPPCAPVELPHGKRTSVDLLDERGQESKVQEVRQRRRGQTSRHKQTKKKRRRGQDSKNRRLAIEGREAQLAGHCRNVLAVQEPQGQRHQGELEQISK